LTPPGRAAADELALLAARAAELARPLDTQQDDDTLDLLVLAVGAQRVAVAVEDVREVRPPGPVAQVPGSNAALAGVVGGRGEALAVATVAALLGLPPTEPLDEQWVIVLDHRTAPLGLLADTAEGIVTVGREELSAPTDPGGLTRALLRDGAVVLDTAAVLRDPRLSLASPISTEEPLWPET
jgi:chemotaxis signal transduction protein